MIKHRIKFSLGWIIISLGLSNNCFAGLNEDLNSYFDGLGFSKNFTSPHAYHGQQAGYYSGGSAFMRSAVQDVQIVQVEMPSFRAGCSGIDVFTGGLSHINNEQIVKTLKLIMNSSGTYAFSLAMETATPALANVMKYWNDIANKANQANINSCEAAEGLVGGMWPRMQGSQQKICQDMGSKDGIFNDWAAAKQKCTTGKEFSNTMNRARNNPQYQGRIFDSGNVVWRAIRKNGFLKNDDELAEFFMSMTGTVIVSRDLKDDDSPVMISPLVPSLMDRENNNLIKVLMEGGEVTLYRCDTKDDDGCLHPVPNKKYKFPSDRALGNRVREMLQHMVTSIINDTALSPQEIGLLESTSLPIYKMLNVQVAFGGGKDALHIPAYSEAVAADILYQYLEQILRIVRNSVETSQAPDGILEKFEPVINQEIADLQNAKQSAHTRMNMSIQMIQQTQLIEKMLAGDLSTHLANSLAWVKGMH